MINSKKKISGGHAAVRALKREQTKHVFGLIGSATMEMFDALAYPSAICVPVRSSLTPINFILFS